MYRYSSIKYNNLLLKMGGIRIGTLHDFRKTEHKQGISDPTEGTKSVNHRIQYVGVDDNQKLQVANSLDKKALDVFGGYKIGEQARNICIFNSTVGKHFNESDCFLLCTSETRSQKTMSQFEGADSCVKITDILSFYHCLTEVINSIVPIKPIGRFRVIYQDRMEKWNGVDWGKHPALIKETAFIKQDEIRAIWVPKNRRRDIEPLNLCDHRLVAFVSKASIP